MNKAESDRFSRALFDQLGRLSRALASPRRLELLDLLAQSERTVEDLARLSAMSVANTSRHLQTLRGARLVVARRAGLHAYYRLADERVFRAWQAIRDLGEARLAEVRELVGSLPGEPAAQAPVALPELLEALRRGTVVLLDARPEEEYRAGHIPGAVSMPLDELDSRLHVLPADQEVLAYCRGPYCLLAHEAVARLRAHGFPARRLALGYPDWRAAGMPCAEGAAAFDTPAGPS